MGEYGFSGVSASIHPVHIWDDLPWALREQLLDMLQAYIDGVAEQLNSRLKEHGVRLLVSNEIIRVRSVAGL
jgi:hypothetical protein